MATLNLRDVFISARAEAPKPWRVVWMDDDTLVVIAIERVLHQPQEWSLSKTLNLLDQGDDEGFRKLVAKPRPFLLTPEEEIPQKYRDMRDSDWALIEGLFAPRNLPMLYFRKYRGIIIREHANGLKLHAKQIHRPLYRYFAGGGEENSLLPHYDLCGPHHEDEEKRKQQPGQAKRGPRPARVLILGDAKLVGVAIGDVRKIAIQGVTKFLRNGVTRMTAWKDTKKHLFNRGHEQRGNDLVPIEPADHEALSYRQFCSIADELDFDKSVAKKNIDTTTWNLQSRAKLSHSWDIANGPCARYEIDATIVDIYLVSVFNRAWIIGRPVLYVVVDVFSGIVAGFYLGLEGPSWEGARLALFNAFSDKVPFCADLGIDITQDMWPCQYVPHYLLGDRGEMIGKASDELPRSLGIIVQNTPPCRGDWKPNVEQQFNLVNHGHVVHVPGAMHLREEEVRKRRYVLDACLTLPELTSILARKFLRYNFTSFKPDRIPDAMLGQNLSDATPIATFNWGMEHITGTAKVLPPEQVWRHLLPRSKARVTREGLYFRGRHYANDRMIREERFARVGRRGTTATEPIWHLSYSPKQIWVSPTMNDPLESCYLLEAGDQMRIARTEEVIERLRLLKHSNDVTRNDLRQRHAAWDSDSSAIIENAKAEAKAAREGMTKSEITSGIDAHRSLEKMANRMERVREEVDSYTQQKPPTMSSSSPGQPSRRPPDDPINDLWKV